MSESPSEHERLELDGCWSCTVGIAVQTADMIASIHFVWVAVALRGYRQSLRICFARNLTFIHYR